MPKLINVHIPQTKIQRKPTMSDSVPCALLFLAARCSLMGISPFAAAMFAAAFDLSIGFWGIASALLGLLSSQGADQCVKYIGAMLLFWLYTALKPDHKDKTLTSATVCAVTLFLCGFINVAYTGANTYNLILLLIESMICSFFYVLFEKASILVIYSGQAPSEQELISGAVCTGIFISGLSGIVPAEYLDLPVIFTTYAIEAIALSMPLSIASSCGVAAGLICSMNSPHAVTLMGMYGFSAIFASLLRHFKKYGVALGFLAGFSTITLFIGNSIAISPIEIIIACGLFIITPNTVHKAMGIFMNKTAKLDIIGTNTKIRDYLCQRLENASRGFATLASTYRAATARRLNFHTKDICTVLDNTINRVCHSCPYSKNCIHSENANTYRILFSLIEVIEQNGFLSSSNATGEFLALCKKQDIFLSELAHCYELFKLDTLKQGEFINNRDMLLRQYEEISEMLNEFHDEISDGFKVLPDIEEKISQELRKSRIIPRDIRAFETATGEAEIFLALNSPQDRNTIAEKVSIATGIQMEYRNNISHSLMRFCPSLQYEIEFGMMQIAKDNKVVSGDSITNFRQGTDKYYVIVCDGMGSGAEAGKESRLTARLLEELLRDGFSPKTSIEMVNSSLAMGIEKEFFSSVDLLSINLMTGVAEFYKIGASKSFIKKHRSVETVFSPSLPVGILPEVHISCISKKLEPGDIVVMMSDGAEGSHMGFVSPERIKKLSDDPFKSMDDLASDIINSSRIKGVKKIRDDMTVATIKLKRRES